MQLSESKLFTIEALNRIEGFVWPEGADWAAMSVGVCSVGFYQYRKASAVVIVDVGVRHPDCIDSIITKAEFDSVDGWVRHDNSECPANSESPIQVQMDGFRVGKPSPPHIAKAWAWVNGGITHWRYHKPTKESAMTTTKQEVKPEIHAIYESYKQQRETTSDAQRALDASKDAEDALLEQIKQWNLQYGFDVRLLDESEENQDQQDSELVITDWRDLQKGDVVKAILVNGASHVNGRVGVVKRIDGSAADGPLFVKFDSVEEWWVKEWKFIRRPQ